MCYLHYPPPPQKKKDLFCRFFFLRSPFFRISRGFLIVRVSLFLHFEYYPQALSTCNELHFTRKAFFSFSYRFRKKSSAPVIYSLIVIQSRFFFFNFFLRMCVKCWKIPTYSHYDFIHHLLYLVAHSKKNDKKNTRLKRENMMLTSVFGNLFGLFSLRTR